jgi:hypothetical protein
MVMIGSVQIFVGPGNMAPYPVDAWAAEEDTYLVLSADPEVVESNEDPERVMAEVLATRPEEPGTVIIKGGHPLRLLAIVHDLNEEPSWKEEWVVRALDGIFQEADKRKVRSLALPLLGTLHGSLEKQRFLVLLREVLERRSPAHLTRLWLVVPAGASSEILQMLKSDLPK